MLFGLPFPTYLGWIIWPVGMVAMLLIISKEYSKYLGREREMEASGRPDADMSREG